MLHRLQVHTFGAVVDVICCHQVSQKMVHAKNFTFQTDQCGFFYTFFEKTQ